MYFPIAFLFGIALSMTLITGCDLSLSESSPGRPATGIVLDAASNKPIAGATVVLNEKEVLQTPEGGTFMLPPGTGKVTVRAHGYMRAEQVIAAPPAGSNSTAKQDGSKLKLMLQPISPKALYLTSYGIESRVLRESALRLIDTTELNTLVIDMKGDRGFVPYKSGVPLAASIGAQKLILLKDIKGTVKALKDRGIYTVARIVVFKDDLLGKARPDLAIKTTSGAVWQDREKLIWVEPSSRAVWDYNIALAIEAARNGFDEIQFDYVRFPDRKGLKFAVQNTEEERSRAISGFLHEARQRLAPFNVFVAADIFGYVAWNLCDTQIGQKIDQVGSSVDYISLMLYPSGFQYGIPGYRNPVANSNRIVYLSLQRARERTNLPSVRFRPWLQAFRDYAFDKRQFTAAEIREQIKASEDFGSNGWMLWNPRNVYTDAGLRRKGTAIPEVVKATAEQQGPEAIELSQRKRTVRAN